MSEIKKFPSEWANEQGFILYDPKGGRFNDLRGFNGQVTLEEFNQMIICPFRTPFPAPPEEKE